MQIHVEMKGPHMSIHVDFDEPGQVPIFRERFEKMINDLAESYGALIVGGSEDMITKEDVRKVVQSYVNKLGGIS